MADDPSCSPDRSVPSSVSSTRSLQGADGLGQLGSDVFAFARQLVESLGVVEQPRQRGRGLDALGEPRALLLEHFGALGIAPDFREAQFLFEGLELAVLPVDIKETSGAPRPFRPATR
jgi:hypothetical protein